MVAGLNLKVDIHRINTGDDDAGGGAVVTGTVTYQNVAARLSSRRPTQVLLEQGLEINRLIDMVLVGQGLTIRERDEVEVIGPVGHPYYQQRFRVLGVQLDGRRRVFGHTEITLSRIERSRNRV